MENKKKAAATDEGDGGGWSGWVTSEPAEEARLPDGSTAPDEDVGDNANDEDAEAEAADAPVEEESEEQLMARLLKILLCPRLIVGCSR